MSGGMQTVITTVVLAVAVGVLVALAGLAILGASVQRYRARAEASLDAVQSRVVEMAIALSDQTRAEGYEARLRLIRAARAAMGEQRQRGRDRP